jgi:hypothetical protein
VCEREDLSRDGADRDLSREVVAIIEALVDIRAEVRHLRQLFEDDDEAEEEETEP